MRFSTGLEGIAAELPPVLWQILATHKTEYSLYGAMMLARSLIPQAQFSTEPVHGYDQQLTEPMFLLLPKPLSIPVQVQY
jgi:hypothetical protein